MTRHHFTRRSLSLQFFLLWLLLPLIASAQTLPPMKGFYYGKVVTQEGLAPMTLFLEEGIASNRPADGILKVTGKTIFEVEVTGTMPRPDLIILTEVDGPGIWESNAYTSVNIEGTFSNNSQVGKGSFSLSWIRAAEKVSSQKIITKREMPKANFPTSEQIFGDQAEKSGITVSPAKTTVTRPAPLLINPGFEIKDYNPIPVSSNSESPAIKVPPMTNSAQSPPRVPSQYQEPTWWQNTKSFLSNPRNQEAILEFTVKAIKAYSELKNGGPSGFDSSPSYSPDFRAHPENPNQHWVYPTNGDAPHLRTNPDGNPWNNINPPEQPYYQGY